MSCSIQHVANLSGLTSRTLRYYDEIGLLKPDRVAANGYRQYDHPQLLRLQQILLLRELGLELSAIAGVIDAVDDPAEALRRQHRRLIDERNRLERLSATVAATLQHLEEGTQMSADKLFDDMTPERAQYLSSLPRKRVAAGLLLTDEHDRVLLVEPTYRPYWQLPGGVAAADESPSAATMRAVERELGLTLAPSRLLVVDWVPPSAGRIEGLLFVYAGPALTAQDLASIVLPPDELSAWDWCPVDELAQRMPPHMYRRTAAALQARGDSEIRYLEDGLAA